MTFDWNLAKDTSMDNHPVYYVQYAHARERWIRDRGRDTRCRVPPAQIRTRGITSYGSYLG
jgi:arginyl-tRNA synthetase